MSIGRLLSLPLLAATLFTGLAVSAAPIVIDGSTFNDRILPGSSPGTSITGITFDGIGESYSLSDFGGPPDVRVTISESETALGGGLHEITVGLRACADLFPTTGEDGLVKIGFGGNPLDLSTSVRLASAFPSIWIDDAMLGEADFVAIFPGSLSSLDPWDGYFPAIGGASGYGSIGARGINQVRLPFVVSENGVPLPGTLALAGAALPLLGALGRRRSG